MALIEIDLDEFTNEEIINFLKSQLNSTYTTDKKKIELREQIRKLLNEDIQKQAKEKNLSLNDFLKLEFVSENLDKIKLEDLEKLIEQ